MAASVSINGASHVLPTKGDTNNGASFSALLQALVTASASWLQFGAASGIAASSNRFARPGIAAIDTTEVFLVAPKAGKLSHLYCYGTSTASGDSVVVTVRVNGSATMLAATVANGQQSASNVVSTFTVAAGDRISVQVTGGGSYSSGLANLIITMAFTPS